MKKLIITLLVLLAIAAVAVITCPDKQDHKEAIMKVLNEKIDDSLMTEDEDESILNSIFGSIGSSIAGYFIDNRLIVENHFLYSTGKVKRLNGEQERISFGIFGHVFTFSKEDLDKALDSAQQPGD
ncbi:MAG: DUF4359 domain-containing protein [Bacteroidales bacterium]|nr:DUF4359 domain-containing protein [Bacteroidales bacterium]